MTRTSPATAFGIAAIGIATYSCMDAIMKILSIASGAYSAVLWRSVAGVLLTGSVFLARRRRWPGRAAILLHIWRGLAAGVSVLLFFWGLARVPMAQSVALTFLAPLIALFLAAPMLGEQIRRAAWVASAIAFAGVLVIALGEVHARASHAAALGTVAIFVASILYAVSLILLRRQAQVADPLEVTLFTSLVIGLLLLGGSPWFASVPRVDQLPAIAVAALLGTVSAMMLAWAYGRAEAQVLVPVEYTAFVWASLLGYWVFGETVSLYTVSGAAMIIAGCLVAIRRPSAVPPTEAAA
jgi:drug/metabolite transporter (DMT)-like permease